MSVALQVLTCGWGRTRSRKSDVKKWWGDLINKTRRIFFLVHLFDLWFCRYADLVGIVQQCLTNWTLAGGMVVQLFMAEQVQFQCYPCDHRHKANSYNYQNAFSDWPTQFTIFQTFLSASWAQTFKPNLLTFDNISFVWTLYHRRSHLRQAVCAAAIRTGKMRVALSFGTVMRQLKMPRSFACKSLVHQPYIEQSFKRAIDADFVETFSS